jgi:DNA-binding NarL/FixJ family response regulator
MDHATQPEHSAEFELLTPREFEVLRLLARGETVKSISETLGVSEKTIANHQSTIREKLGAKNSVQLSRLAERHGLLP